MDLLLDSLLDERHQSVNNLVSKLLGIEVGGSSGLDGCLDFLEGDWPQASDDGLDQAAGVRKVDVLSADGGLDDLDDNGLETDDDPVNKLIRVDLLDLLDLLLQGLLDEGFDSDHNLASKLLAIEVEGRGLESSLDL